MDFVEYAEEYFVEDNNPTAAFNFANTGKEFEPWVSEIDNYIAAYRIHMAAQEKTANGQMDWYGILGFEKGRADPSKFPEELLAETAIRLAKMVHPKYLESAAAKGAFLLVLEALEVLTNPTSRLVYHLSCGMPPPEDGHWTKIDLNFNVK